MMPKQCILSEVEMPQVLHRWIDVRKVFQESMRTGQDAGLLKMCQALGIRFVGQAHSGIADARNIARVALVLIQEYPALLLSTSQIKGLKVSEEGAEEVDAIGGMFGANSGQASFEEKREKTVCARIALLGATEPDEKKLEADLRNMKLSRDEVRRVLHHVRLLGRIPDPDSPGELRRYRAVLGDEMVKLQLSMEAAWAASLEEIDAEGASGGEGNKHGWTAGARHGDVSLEQVRKVQEAMRKLPALRAGSAPLVDGKWLLQQAGAQPGKVIGKIKQLLHYSQVDRDLPDFAAVEKVLKEELTLGGTMDKRLLEARLNSLPRLQWPPNP